MRKTIPNLLLLNFVFIILIIGIYSIGYEYDKANKLYPEVVQVSYDVSIGNVYGQRWQRIGTALLLSGLLLEAIAGMIWYMRRKRNDHKIILDKSD